MILEKSRVGAPWTSIRFGNAGSTSLWEACLRRNNTQERRDGEDEKHFDLFRLAMQIWMWIISSNLIIFICLSTNNGCVTYLQCQFFANYVWVEAWLCPFEKGTVHTHSVTEYLSLWQQRIGGYHKLNQTIKREWEKRLQNLKRIDIQLS